MWKEFKKFAMRGNVIDMAVGIVIGTTFGVIVKSLVSDVIMPPIGMILGKADFTNLFIILKEGKIAGPYASLTSAQEAGAVTINYGVFANTIVNFIIVAFALFLIIRVVNKIKAQEETLPAKPTTKDCPYCLSHISINATRCPHCTSKLVTT